jgi:hypothetical protein
MRAIITLLLSCAVIQACRASRTTTPLTLVGGSHALQGQFPSVLIWAPSSVALATSYCTGAKISDRLILTAAHCVLEQDPLKGQDYIGPWRHLKSVTAEKSIQFSQSLILDDHAETLDLTVTQVHWHPHVERCLTDPKWRFHKDCIARTPLPDVAVIEVEPTPNFTKIPSAAISTDFVAQHQEITILGYGVQSEDDTRPPTLKFHKTAVSSRRDIETALIGTEAERDGSPSFDRFFGVAGVLVHQAEANLGSGDSGGPVLRHDDGRIVGINSDGYCMISSPDCERTTNSFFSRLDDASHDHVGRWLTMILASSASE